VSDEQTPKLGKVHKVVFLDEHGAKIAEGSSLQMPEDPFRTEYGDGLVQPPYPLEQLVYLAEIDPIHGACIDQRATDVVGGAYSFEPASKKQQADEEEVLALNKRFKSLAGTDTTMLEQFQALVSDHDATGMAYWEISRDLNGKVRRLYHMPAHTVRAHKDGVRFCQIRQGNRVWFKKWGCEDWEDPGDIDFRTGGKLRKGNDKYKANEVLVFKKTSRRSTYYGIPTWVSAVGWITLGLAARDYNILFFKNHREPRWAVIMTNLEGGEDFDSELKRAFTIDLKSPHRNLLIPVEGAGDIKFQKLSEDQNDGSFQKLLMQCQEAVMVAHRMPPDRIGLGRSGALAGSVAGVINRVYKEGVIIPAQEMFEHRINMFLRRELEMEDKFVFRFNELDLTEEAQDMDMAVQLFTAGLVKLNEGRAIIKQVPVDGDQGEKFAFELMPKKPDEMGNSEAGRPQEPNSPHRNRFSNKKGVAEVEKKLELLDDAVSSLLEWQEEEGAA
jgi:PBSX family phage portal protein